MMTNGYDNLINTNFDSITVKVEHPEYGPMETITTATELTSMRLFVDSEPAETYIAFKNEPCQKIIAENSVIDFIETSIDKFLDSYQKDNLSKGAQRQRVYRENESQLQRERRLASARRYIRKRREIENEEERYDRLKKQRDRVRAIRSARKLNPELDKIRRRMEAERMKMRRANETDIQRMRRLEKSRLYSKKRRENEIFRKLENAKNRIAHQNKRLDLTFRAQERQRDRLRKKMKRQIEYRQNLPVSLSPIELGYS